MKFQGFLAAMASADDYCLEDAIADFFTLTSTSRETCNTKAVDLVGGNVVPVAIQGNCSYSVYAGPEFEFVVQFRPKSLRLRLEIIHLAHKIYGSLVPTVLFHGELGENNENPLLIYVMPRVRGTSYLDLILANSFAESSDQNLFWRKNLLMDVAW